MASFSTVPWGSVSESDFASPEDYCRSCLIDMNEAGEAKTKGKCKLPVRMPNGGAVNRNAVHAAAAALAGARGGVSASAAEKKAAARKLMRLYGMMDEDAPDSLRRMGM